MDTPTPSILQVLQESPELLRFHLFGNDVDPGEAPAVGAFIESTFDGYEPRPPDVVFPAPLGLSFGDAAREMLVAWHSVDGEPQTVFGWYCTLEPAPGVVSLIAYERLPQAEVMSQGKTLSLRVALSVTPNEAGPGLRLFVSQIALAFFGEGLPMSLRGRERQILLDAKKVLEQIARRDSEIPSLTARSKRSRVAVVPADNADLVAAFSAVIGRVNSMLAL